MSSTAPTPTATALAWSFTGLAAWTAWACSTSRCGGALCGGAGMLAVCWLRVPGWPGLARPAGVGGRCVEDRGCWPSAGCGCLDGLGSLDQQVWGGVVWRIGDAGRLMVWLPGWPGLARPAGVGGRCVEGRECWPSAGC
eukprot:353893-Chlamydomonas_euryale.AAC.1